TNDQKIRDYFRHMHLVQDLFLKVWRGDPFEMPSAEVPPLSSILELARTFHKEIETFLAKLEEPALSGEVKLPWAGHFTEKMGKEPAPITLTDTLLQVVNHSTYHRGQVNARLRQIEVTPPMTDHIVWVAIGKPAGFEVNTIAFGTQSS